MKMKMFCVVLVTAVFNIVSPTYALEKHPNGWIYPMNRQPTNEEWNSWHSYAGHVGHDYMQSAGQPVRAIADGWIEDWKDGLAFYGSKSGALGSAVLLGHRAIDNSGKEIIFYTVYGHDKILSKFKKKGKLVRAGEVFATTHKYYYYGTRADHIHLGIRPYEVECCGKQFRGFSSDGKDHGWVNPKTFLNAHYPLNQGYFYVSEGNTHIAWSPSNVPCKKAKIWSYNQTCSAENSYPGICDVAHYQLLQENYNEYSKDKYDTMFFGSIEDFQQFCH